MAKTEQKPSNSRCPDCEWSLVRVKPTDIYKCCNPDCKNVTAYKEK
jgi:ribosomal protein L37AE/L43A